MMYGTLIHGDCGKQKSDFFWKKLRLPSISQTVSLFSVTYVLQQKQNSVINKDRNMCRKSHDKLINKSNQTTICIVIFIINVINNNNNPDLFYTEILHVNVFSLSKLPTMPFECRRPADSGALGFHPCFIST